MSAKLILGAAILSAAFSAAGTRIAIEPAPRPPLIQTDAAVNPGTSGGLAVDRRPGVLQVSFRLLGHTSHWRHEPWIGQARKTRVGD
ncbi:MAG: hypothetical protein ABSB75_05325 [Candidatus Limnocylindrales bacterium]